jgi:putative membrane protein
MIRTTLAIAAAGLVLLTLAGPAAGTHGPAEAGQLLSGIVPSAATQPAEIVNDEVVLAELDATGLPERAVLISRTTVQGPEREVIDPASGTNVRYLDRLGRPEVGPDGVVLVVGGDRTSALTEARFDKPLPVAVHAEYAVEGSVVPATTVPGAAGAVTVTYTLTNTTAEQTTLTYADAAGREQQSQEPVFIPFQGTLTVTLPEGAQLVDAPDAMLATDEQGRTVARWSISLFPPISTPIQTVSLSMRDDRAAVPAATVVLTPAGTDQDPATGFSADLLTGTHEGNGQLYEGLDALDAAAGELAQGSDQLAAGLAGLAGGANAAAGASESLARGVGGLAEGAEAAADASTSLARGVGQLADGADDVSAGSEELAGALGEAATGAQDLADATAALARATAGSPADQIAPLLAGGAQIEAGLLAAAARIGGPPDPVLDITAPLPPDGDTTCPPGGTAPPDDDCATIYQGVRALRDGLRAVDEVVGRLEGRVDEARAAFAALVADLGSLKDDVTDAAQGARELYDSLCVPIPPATDPTLDQASCDQIQAVIDAAESALGTAGGALPDITDLVAAIVALEAQAKALSATLDNALASTEKLLLGVEAIGLAVGSGTPTQTGLATAMAALNAGLRQFSAQLTASQAELTTALTAVAEGSKQLATGIDDAATGADALAEGSQELAAGATGAATGADQLADGQQQLAEGAAGAASGADQLSTGLSGLADGADAAAAAGQDIASGATALERDGTAPAAQGVLDASTDAALAKAWLEASAARASDALPYGPPVGAEGNVAYVFTLAEVPAPRSFWERIRAVFGG